MAPSRDPDWLSPLSGLCVWPTLVLTWPSGRDSCSCRRSAGQLPGLKQREGDEAQTGEVPDRPGLRARLCSEPGCPRARVNPSQAARSGIHIGGAVALGSPGICLQTLGSPTPPLFLAFLVSLCIHATAHTQQFKHSFKNFIFYLRRYYLGLFLATMGWSKILFQFFHRLLQKTQIKFLARPIKESQTKYSPEEIQKSFHPKSRSKLGFPLPSITMNATCDREQTTS